MDTCACAPVFCRWSCPCPGHTLSCSAAAAVAMSVVPTSGPGDQHRLVFESSDRVDVCVGNLAVQRTNEAAILGTLGEHTAECTLRVDCNAVALDLVGKCAPNMIMLSLNDSLVSSMRTLGSGFHSLQVPSSGSRRRLLHCAGVCVAGHLNSRTSSRKCEVWSCSGLQCCQMWSHRS